MRLPSLPPPLQAIKILHDLIKGLEMISGSSQRQVGGQMGSSGTTVGAPHPPYAPDMPLMVISVGVAITAMQYTRGRLPRDSHVPT